MTQMVRSREKTESLALINVSYVFTMKQNAKAKGSLKHKVMACLAWSNIIHLGFDHIMGTCRTYLAYRHERAP